METARLVIDTDIVIDFLRKRNQILRNVMRRFPVGITPITIYEILSVPTFSEKQAELFRQLLTKTVMLSLEAHEASDAAQVYRHLASQGQLISLPDILIAGICLAHDLPLLTRNRAHFERIPALVLFPLDTL